MLKERNPALVILFSVLTCGIYGIYWYIVVTDEIEATLKQRDGSVASGGMVFLFSLLTCGFYMIYWYYKQGQRIALLGREYGLALNDNSTLYLILCIVGVGIINIALMQSDLNSVAFAQRSGSSGGYNAY